MGLFIAVPVIVFLPDVFAKYNLKEIHRRTNQNLNSIHISNLKVNYHDLNGDGKHEIIESFGFQKGDYKIHSIQYFSDNGGLFDQINFKGKYSTLISNIFFSDLNKNG